MAGAVTVVPGSAAGLAAASALTVSQNSGSIAGSSESGDAFGTDMAAGDTNGDGHTDLIVGAPGEDDISGHADRGSVTILDGASHLTTGTSFTTSAADRTATSARLGTAVAAGDFNHDGKDDVIAAGLGSKSAPGGWITWRNSATDDLTTQQLTYAALTYVDLTTGDFNGDGYTDAAATTVDINGRATVYEYQSTGTAGLKHSTAVQMNGGRSIDSGDINGDGRDDIIVGQPVAAETASTGYHGYTGGQITIKYGQEYGLWYGGHTTTINQDTPEIPGAAEAGDAMGTSVTLTDLNNDGHPDILTGLPGEDLTTHQNAGSALAINIITNGDQTTVTSATAYNQGTSPITGAPESADRFGSAVTGGHYLPNGNGLVIGAAGENNNDGTLVTVTPAGTSTALGRTSLDTPINAFLGDHIK
ncbi:VCBS repeat-containing protein [Streptomyces sp. NBC_01471]|uniref:FG-GAP-like repeat-containing protein n=1 Tax=Streptomyces sp. NBC_01471 TaxID=2903879 RepID=UPI00324E43B3